jgi:EAL domain-containing protein (putative c-di-GMP-specific phosphodiesterase class I)
MPETLAILREIGVDYAQGFAISHPQPYITAYRLPLRTAVHAA